MITVDEVRRFLRVIHTADDELLLDLIDGAEDEALQYLNRRDFDGFDSTSWSTSGGVVEFPASVRHAVYLLVQARYEGTKPEDQRRLREAAETLLTPYRVHMGV